VGVLNRQVNMLVSVVNASPILPSKMYHKKMLLKEFTPIVFQFRVGFLLHNSFELSVKLPHFTKNGGK
jgi:hypothetical protein